MSKIDVARKKGISIAFKVMDVITRRNNRTGYKVRNGTRDGEG